MPSSPSVHVSSLIRLPRLQTANPANKEQYAAALPAAPAQDCSFAQPSPWVFPVAEELPTATVACLKVLNHILLEASPATAAPFDLAENRYDEEHGTHSAGGDRTSGDEGKKVGCDNENKTQMVLHNSSKYAKRSRDNDVLHAERTCVATNGSVGGSGRRDHEVYASEENSKELVTHPRGITKSYASIFKLLHAAGVLNTLPKCLHMLHAVCILADQHRHIGTPIAAFDQESPPGAFVRSPKRRKLAVDSGVVVQAVGGGGQAHECDGRHGSRCDANTDSGSLAEQREMRYLLTGAPLSPEHSTNKHADNAETVCCNSDVRESFSQGAQVGVGSLPNDCESPAVCCSGRAHMQDSSGGRRQATHLILHRQTRTAHIAGLVLGCIEALEAPPPLSDPTFHEKVLHVLCRLFYTVHPLEGKHSTAHEAPTLTSATRVSEDNDGAAVNGSVLNNKKATGSFDGLTNQLFDAYGEGKRLDRSTSYEGRSLMPLTPHKWRQQIVARFDTVERLLLCSVPTLFLGETAPTAPATEQGTLGTVTRSVDAVTGGAEADEDLFPDSEDVGACCGGSAATTGTAERLRDLGKGDIQEPDARAGPALKRATSAAVLLQGGERCRRALRMVRRWVAFLLELEQERQTLVQRVLQASEEVQGLPHMLLQDRCEAEQQAQQLNMKNPGQSCSSTTTSKRRTLLILGTPREGGAKQEHHKHGLEKEAAWIERGVGPQSEELEIRIRATRQLLLLPSIPPFTRPEVEAVHSARARFERCLLRWREAQDRRRQEEEEARKKAAAAAAAVAYVTDRMQEQQQAQAAAFAAPPGTAASATALLRLRSISHAFYLLGLNPQTATSQMVEQVRKKWRVLLHPDKFVSVHSHLLQQATEAFKAFHVAVTEANRILSQRRVEPSWSPPPPPPDLTSAAHSAAAAAAPVSAAAAVPQHARNETQQTPVKGAADATPAPASCGENSPTETHKSCCPLPTHQFFPDVTVQASRSKKKACTGGLVLHVHAAPSREGEWPFAVIKEIRVFVLRPTLSEGPLWKLLPSTADVCLVLKKSVELKCAFQTAAGEPSASAVATGKNGACPTNKVEIDALQPIELGVEKVYWVGVQVEGLRKSQSLVTWKPVTVCLALPEDADNNAPSHLDDSSSSSSAFDGDGTLNEANVGCRSFSAANRALLAFLQTFVETPFVKEDCSFNGRLRDSIASLRRVLRQQKKIKRSEHARECRQDTDEWRWVGDEAKEVLRECMEKARTWESEEDKETMASATG